MAGVGSIVLETLTEDNYEQWKRCLKNYLVGHGLWGVVSGFELKPDKGQEPQYSEWKRKNALALHAIQLSCGMAIYSKFNNQVHLSAHHAWTHLAEKAMAPRMLHSFDHMDEETLADVHGSKEYLKHVDLYRAIEEGDLQETISLVNRTPGVVMARVSSHDDTALHIAILCGHMEIAEYLVSMMEAEDLEPVNEYGATALSLAAISGDTRLAKAIVDKNRNLLTVRNDKDDGQLPVIVAALYGQKNMVRYLYKETPKCELHPEKGGNGVKLLNCLITAEIYDVASMLLKQYPKLGVIPDSDGHYALRILAEKPSAFPSGTQFTLWGKLIYLFVQVHTPWDTQTRSTGAGNFKDVEHGVLKTQGDESNEVADDSSLSSGVRGMFHKLGWDILQCFVPEIKYIHHRKVVHTESVKLIGCMFKEIRGLSYTELDKMDIDAIIYDSIKHGIVEIISHMIKYKPEIIWKKDAKGRTIFAHAIVLRQEKIFALIHKLGAKKHIMARRHDAFRNNYLHLAAKLSPQRQLERVSGAALQMQRELQWFKNLHGFHGSNSLVVKQEVERIVQPKLKEEVNENNKTPEVLFTEEHRKLIKDGESWMKNTAGSSMIVGTLIAAVMFTTAFTVPGGNKDDTGLPTMLVTHPKPFLVFIISNALSLFSSLTALMKFSGILTARYAEKDFLKSLPTKLIFGLASLFFSITTMMVSFAAALYLILHEKLSWISIPIIIFSVIPIILFSIIQFPILIEMTMHTHAFTIYTKILRYLI